MGKVKEVFMLLEERPELSEEEAYQIIIKQYSKDKIHGRKNTTIQTNGRNKPKSVKKIMVKPTRLH